MKIRRRSSNLLIEPPSSATGDIAFNLIIFFLVCASVQPDSGRHQTLPRSEETEQKQEKNAEKKKSARFDELNEAYIKLGDAFDLACEERTFWGRGWSDKAQADEAQVRVSAVFDEMEPIIDELETLSSTEEREGGPEGVVWVMLRK